MLRHLRSKRIKKQVEPLIIKDTKGRKFGLECVHLTTGEAQETKGWAAINSQWWPYDRVRQVSFMRPLSKALNYIVSSAAYRWVTPVAGDIILNENASYYALKAIEYFQPVWHKALAVRIPIYDPFIGRNIGGLVAYQAHVNEYFKHRDVMNDDVDIQRRAFHEGYKIYSLEKKDGIVIVNKKNHRWIMLLSLNVCTNI